ncbi:MAG: hypothetical protein KDB61_05900 [Planctomycetes bacterium]|nr:hypothetical protein [Planctomycetota bacterium]
MHNRLLGKGLAPLNHTEPWQSGYDACVDSVTRERAWQRWQKATSYRELCLLAVEFLDGDLPAFPGWMAPDIDEETDPWVPQLVAANQRGFLTTASQPGGCPPLSHDALPWRQRAFVVGFAPAGLVEELRGQVKGTRLSLFDFESSAAGGEPIGVLQQGPRESLFVGTGEGPAELAIFAEFVSPAALRELAETRYLCLVDPEWGRDDLLWPILANERRPE